MITKTEFIIIIVGLVIFAGMMVSVFTATPNERPICSLCCPCEN